MNQENVVAAITEIKKLEMVAEIRESNLEETEERDVDENRSVCGKSDTEKTLHSSI